MKAIVAGVAVAIAAALPGVSQAKQDYFEIAALMIVANEQCGDLFSEEAIGVAGMLAAEQKDIDADPEILAPIIAVRAAKMRETLKVRSTRNGFCSAAKRVAADMKE